MTQNPSSRERDDKGRFAAEIKDEDITIEGEVPDSPDGAGVGDSQPAGDQPASPEPVIEDREDIEALRKQLHELQNARESAQRQTAQAEAQARQAAEQMAVMRDTAFQSQYDALITAMGAAQIEVDAAKNDIVAAGTNQDYVSLAEAQDRLAAARTRLVSLEMGKENYERAKTAQPRQQAPQREMSTEQIIESNNQLLLEEKRWLKQHQDALTDQRQAMKLNAAYLDAEDRGIERGSPEYFGFLNERMGYENKSATPSENPAMVAAPPSRSTPSGAGTGGGTTRFTLTAEEAEIARSSGISPAEYVKQKLKLQQLKKEGHYPQ